MEKEHFFEVTLRFAVRAETTEIAAEIVKEEMQQLNDTLADHHVYEWCNPQVYDDK